MTTIIYIMFTLLSCFVSFVAGGFAVMYRLTQRFESHGLGHLFDSVVNDRYENPFRKEVNE